MEPQLQHPMTEEELARILREMSLDLATDARRIGAPGSEVREKLALRSVACSQAAGRIVRWYEIWRDELAETLRIVEALNISNPGALEPGRTLIKEILDRIKLLRDACSDFVRNCPACGGRGQMPDAVLPNGDLSPAGLCVWCERFRRAL